MVPVLILSSLAGLPLSEGAIDRLVSTRTVVVQRQVQLSMKVHTGDPLGSMEAGTIKSLAEPTLTALHKQTTTFLAGRMADALTGQTAEGIEIKVKPLLRLDGKIDVNCETSLHTVNTSRGITTAAGFSPGVDTQTVQTNATLKPGQPLKVRLSAKSAEDQTWMELTASVVEAPTAVPPPPTPAAELRLMAWSMHDVRPTAPPAMMPAVPMTMPAVMPTPVVRQVQMVVPPVLPTTGK